MSNTLRSMDLWFVAHKDYAFRWMNLAFTEIEFYNGEKIYDIRSFPKKKWAEKYRDRLDDNFVVIKCVCSPEAIHE